MEHWQQLPLPEYGYLLLSLFKALDSTINVMRNGRAIRMPFFDDVRYGVETICKRAFTKTHLAQIKYLVPEWLDVRYGVKAHSDESLGPPENRLMIDFVLQADSSKTVEGDIDAKPVKIHQIPSTADARALEFRHRIINYIKPLHSPLIKNLRIDPDRITMWHKDFDLESIVFPEATLPAAPETVFVQKGPMYVPRHKAIPLVYNGPEHLMPLNYQKAQATKPGSGNKISSELLKEALKIVRSDTIEMVKKNQENALIASMTKQSPQQGGTEDVSNAIYERKDKLLVVFDSLMMMYNLANKRCLTRDSVVSQYIGTLKFGLKEAEATLDLLVKASNGNLEPLNNGGVSFVKCKVRIDDTVAVSSLRSVITKCMHL